jgi:transposase
MFDFSPEARIFVALEPVDLRRGFNGLYGLVQTRLQADPLTGHWFVFTNHRRNRLKVLHWDGTGLWLCTKRLEKGTFGWPAQAESGSGVAHWRPEDFLLLLSGLELRSRPHWYRPDKK